LPAPLGPRSPRTSPCSTSKVTSEMASLLPNRRLTPATCTPAVTRCGLSGAVVGRVGRHPLGVGFTRRNGCLGDERLGPVVPVDDREAVARVAGGGDPSHVASVASFVVFVPMTALALNRGAALPEDATLPPLTARSYVVLLALWTVTAWLGAALAVGQS